jgi:ribosomal protein S3
VLYNKLNNIEDECRKQKLIEYIKDIVKKHRTENIYFYLSTIADARKSLRKIKLFTKHHADFLFGLPLRPGTVKTVKTAPFSSPMEGLPPYGGLHGGRSFPEDKQSPTKPWLQKQEAKNLYKREIKKDKINQRVNKVFEKASKKTIFEKTLQDIFLEQIEKQKTMCLQNLQLTPKISIRFYSVNKKTLEQKASIVSHSVVDALEKRKAFRKIIKDAKETLMRSPGVKGVKIQVAGRLNGAEIARTEWVRAGRVPLQTLRANLDYSYRTANTIYGIIGVRVWIFKGIRAKSPRSGKS